MIGAIAGDIIGSVYERYQIKTTDFALFQNRCRFTDDSVLTVAIAKAILEGTSYFGAVKELGRKYAAGAPEIKNAGDDRPIRSQFVSAIYSEIMTGDQQAKYQAVILHRTEKRHFRDAKLTEIGDGTSEIQRLIIADELIKRPVKH